LHFTAAWTFSLGNGNNLIYSKLFASTFFKKNLNFAKEAHQMIYDFAQVRMQTDWR